MNDWQLNKWFDESRLQQLCADTGSGTTLPNSAYTSDEFHAMESATVFRNSWAFVAFDHDLSAPGDSRPIEVAGLPVFLIRGEDGQIRAFHNACPHRGAQLVVEPGRQQRNIVCPNHSWSFALDGRLLARPHFNGGGHHDINHAPCHPANLKPVRCERWRKWWFVNLSGDAASLNNYTAYVDQQLEGYNFDELHFSTSLDFEINANWKLAIENFIEPYHVFSCHPWLNGFVGMEERTAPGYHGHVLSCGYEFKNVDPARGGALPHFTNLPKNRKNRGDWFVLFPNFAFEIFPDQVDVFIAEPLGTERCRETIALYFVGEGASSDRYREARQHVIQNWHDLNQEDIGVIERMQRGRRSEGFNGGVLSPYWDPVLQHFARLIAGAMTGQPNLGDRYSSGNQNPVNP